VLAQKYKPENREYADKNGRFWLLGGPLPK
jgi:hypothetical protein